MIAHIQSFLAKVRELAGRIAGSRLVRVFAYPLLALLVVLLASPWLALLVRALLWGSANDQQTAITLIAVIWAVREMVRRWRSGARSSADRAFASGAKGRGSESHRAHGGRKSGRKRAN